MLALQHRSNDSSFNFTASVYPLYLNKPNIILLNHIDVVPPGDTSLWNFPAYEGTITNDNYILGRGAIDNKGMAIAQLFAASYFIEAAKMQELPFNITVLCVAGEETDGYNGASIVVEQFLDKLNPHVVLGEGGSGVKNIITSQPDKIVFGISTVEKAKLAVTITMDLASSGHGSVPPNEYAMKEMVVALNKLLTAKPVIRYHGLSARGLRKLGKHEKGIHGFVQRHFTFFLFRPIVKREIQKNPMLISMFTNTIALTNINLPESFNNQISQKVSATLDCRLLPGTNPERFIKKIAHDLDDDRMEVKALNRFDNNYRTNNPPVYKLLSESLIEIFPSSVPMEIIFPATTDNNYFRSKNIPVFGIFPACFEMNELTSIHNVNEKIHIDRLTDAINVYRIFLSKMMQSPKQEKSSALIHK